MVVFCLISPDFATCCLALHKHLFSVVVKKLTTLASLALSILAPMFGENKLKPIFFHRAKVTFLKFSALKSHVWLRNDGWMMECEALVAFSFYPVFF